MLNFKENSDTVEVYGHSLGHARSGYTNLFASEVNAQYRFFLEF